MCLSKSSPEKQSGAYIRIYKELYYKELATQLWRLTSPKMCSQQAGDPGGQVADFRSESWQARDPGRASVTV